MRIGNQHPFRGSDVRVDRSEANATSGPASRVRTDPSMGRLKSDIEVLREEMKGFEEDRSELLARVKDRMARGDYLTPESADEVAAAVVNLIDNF